MTDFEGAVLARAKVPGVNATDTPPSSPTYPYTVIYFDGAPRTAEREADVHVTQTHGFYSVTVGVSAVQARESRKRLVERFTDWSPLVDGRTVSKVVHDGTQPTRSDASLPDRTLFIATDQWRAVSTPV